MASSLTGCTSATSNTESYYGGDDRWIAGKRAWSFDMSIPKPPGPPPGPPPRPKPPPPPPRFADPRKAS